MTTDTRSRTRRIKDALISILEGIQYDVGNGPEPAFSAVLDNTHNDVEGSPVARVLPGRGIKVSTGSNTQKDYQVPFSVIISWPLEDPSDIEQSLYDRMYDITDLILEKVAAEDYIGELSTIDPQIINWRMDVSGTNWRLAAGRGGALLLCEVQIEVTYSQDVF
jgi:hypothetical protein